MSIRRYLIGMFLLALALLAPQPAEASDFKALCAAREGDLPPWWVDVCGDPQPPVSPPLPPLTEDDGEEPPLPPSGCWTTPSGQRLCPGEDGRELPEHSDHGGVILVDLWPEWHTREGDRPTVEQIEAYMHASGWFATEDGEDDTPTLDDPSERGGAPLGTEDEDPTPDDGTPTAGQVEAPTATPAPLPCPPGTTPAFGGLVCLGYWSPFGDWREVDWSIEPDLKDEPCGGKGQPPCPGAPLPVPPCPPRHFVCPELGCCPHGDPGGMDPRTPPTDGGE